MNQSGRILPPACGGGTAGMAGSALVGCIQASSVRDNFTPVHTAEALVVVGQGLPEATVMPGRWGVQSDLVVGAGGPCLGLGTCRNVVRVGADQGSSVRWKV